MGDQIEMNQSDRMTHSIKEPDRLLDKMQNA